jgi:hypothetical protein
MSRKHFSWLAILALAAVVVVFLLPGDEAQEADIVEQPLLPGLQEQANDIAWLQVSAAGGEIIATLVRSDAGWTVEEADGYRADWEVLKSLLSGLAAARVVEPKTSNPSYYDRLGVEDVSAPDASGVQLAFAASTGLSAVILGNDARGREGQYARLAGAARSVLLDRSLDLPADRSAWLDRTIIDISDSEVVEVEIRHADGEIVVARKSSADDEDFVLEGVAEGFEPKSAWTVNSLAGSLSSLDLDDTSRADQLNWEGASSFRLLSADGLNVEVDLLAVPVEGEGEADEARWIRLHAGLYTTALGSGVEGNGDNAETAARADVINNRVAGWAYRIPDYKFNAMNKRMADLVQAVEPQE